MFEVLKNPTFDKAIYTDFKQSKDHNSLERRKNSKFYSPEYCIQGLEDDT